MNEKEIKSSNHSKKGNYESSLSLRIVSFLIPLVGLIVYAVNVVPNPKIAKECGKFALYGFIIGVVIGIIAISIIIGIGISLAQDKPTEVQVPNLIGLTIKQNINKGEINIDEIIFFILIVLAVVIFLRNYIRGYC